MSCGVTHGDSSGVATNSRLGRLGAVSATSAAVCVSPVTIASGRPVRRSKLSAKKRPISAAGCATRRSTANVHGNSSTAIATISGGNSSSIAQVYCVSRWWTMRMRSGARTITASAVSTISAGARKFSARPVNSAARPIATAGSERKAIDERPCVRIDGRALNLGGGTARRQREAAAEQHQHDETGMADHQEAEQSQPGLCVVGDSREAGEAHGVEHAGLLDPDQMAVEHQHEDGAADIGLRPGELLAAALA